MIHRVLHKLVESMPSHLHLYINFSSNSALKKFLVLTFYLNKTELCEEVVMINLLPLETPKSSCSSSKELDICADFSRTGCYTFLYLLPYYSTSKHLLLPPSVLTFDLQVGESTETSDAEQLGKISQGPSAKY